MKSAFKIFSIILICGSIYAQDFNAIPYLKEVEAGRSDKVKEQVSLLRSQYFNDPSFLFLDAVLTEDGTKAVKLYEKIYESYPKSKFADASLYRSFAFYYALGLYKKAEDLKLKLKKDYPSSPYIRTADRNIPEEDENYIYIDDKKPVNRTDTRAKFTIQAGAFLNYQNAAALRQSLINEGYESQIVPKDVGGSSLNVVTVGRFATKEDTAILLKHLEDKYQLKGRVINLE